MIDLVFGQRFTVESEPVVSPAGRTEIVSLLNQHRLPGLSAGWDWSLNIDSGPLKGKIGTRIAAALHKSGYTVPASLKEEIGNIADKHRGERATAMFDFDKDLAWRRGDFGDDGSCFWTVRKDARKMMVENHCWAVRFYDPVAGHGIGRAWLAPDLPEEDTMIIFNGYGPWGNALVTIAKYLTIFFGGEYKQIVLENHGSSDGTLWINGRTGYIVSRRVEGKTPPMPVLKSYASYDFMWADPMYAHYCSLCHRGIRNGSFVGQYRNQPICGACYEDRFRTCSHCGQIKETEEFTTRMLCHDCVGAFYATNHITGEYLPRTRLVYVDGEDIYVDMQNFSSMLEMCDFDGKLYRRAGMERVGAGTFVASQNRNAWRERQAEREGQVVEETERV